MAKTSTRPQKSEPAKLQRLPKDVKITKRPLIRPAIPSPYAGRQNPKVVYISCKTPFMSAFKRVRQLFRHIDKRSMQVELTRQHQAAGRRHGRPSQVNAAAAAEESPEPVIVKATGRAIDKALRLALFLQQQPEYDVRIVTGSVAAIDDIVRTSDYIGGDVTVVDCESAKIPEGSRDEDVVMAGKEEDDADELESDVPDARIRTTSIIEILVTLR